MLPLINKSPNCQEKYLNDTKPNIRHVLVISLKVFSQL